MRRLESLDVLRGFALCGILFANAPGMLHLKRLQPDGSIDPVATALDYIVTDRFFPLFSLLFGISFALLWRSVRTRTAAPRRALAQRLLMLLIFGILHHLLQPGEALLPYAVFGLIFLLPATALPERWAPLVTAVIGVAALLGALVVENKMLLVPGLFLLGFAVGSTTLPQRLDAEPRYALWSLPALIPLTALGLWVQDRHPQAALAVGLVMAATYACLILAARSTRLRGALRAVFAPLGRTALTNYIAASVILVGSRRIAEALSTTPGLPRPGAWAQTILLCVLILVVQCAASSLWLNHFDQGPLEKLWRAVTYWRVPVKIAATSNNRRESRSWQCVAATSRAGRMLWDGFGCDTYRSRWLDPLMVAVIAMVISVIGAGVPSFWYDEASTISATDRSLPDLVRMLVNFDAVHGLYYLGMHEWFALFPRTEAWARLPSSIAIGLAAAGVVVLTKLLSSRTAALSAGLLFAILPRATWAGVEARSYALTAAAAVWLTVVLLVAARHRLASIWVLYAVLLYLSVLLNIYLVLMVTVHLVVLSAMRQPRRVLAAWAASTATAAVGLIPSTQFIISQARQVDWIAPLSRHTVVQVLILQYFDHALGFATIAAIVLIAAILRRRRRPQQSVNSTPASIRGLSPIAVMSLAWIAIPTGILLTYSVAAQPIYTERYLCFTAPAAAVGLGIAIQTVTSSRTTVAVLVAVFALAATPNYIHQRGSYAKAQDYRQVADLIRTHAAPGDCLLLDETADLQPGSPSYITAAYPTAFVGLTDVAFQASAAAAAQLSRVDDAPPEQLTVQISRCRVLWTITARDLTLPANDRGAALPPGPAFGRTGAYRVPHAIGFRLVQRWQFTKSQVIRSIR
ncbi:DUF418 domain-containing protein [Nocardia sp. CDC160]|uniref:DUF418 domain-containing protein n=1 Tax=Nocardia sp. CDC160 TaxID=3112166 RepID=UPI002DBEFE8D|nr:DUF418 domain-containing protein [Nocardia sp. CDC160]MEC3917977.1 DUF418 domain-containing protein [Nocardia sp. CDC160]